MKKSQIFRNCFLGIIFSLYGFQNYCFSMKNMKESINKIDYSEFENNTSKIENFYENDRNSRIGNLKDEKNNKFQENSLLDSKKEIYFEKIEKNEIQKNEYLFSEIIENKNINDEKTEDIVFERDMLEKTMNYILNVSREKRSEVIKKIEESLSSRKNDKTVSKTINTLGNIYSNAFLFGIESNFEKAIYYLEKAIKFGEAESMLCLSDILLRGNKDVKRDIKRALELLNMAVEKKHTHAMYKLAGLYMSGIPLFLEKDIGKSISLFEQAAGLGNTKAMDMLGGIYFVAKGELQSYSKSIYWHLKAAKKLECKSIKFFIIYKNDPNINSSKKLKSKMKEAYEKISTILKELTKKNNLNQNEKSALKIAYLTGEFGIEKDYNQVIKISEDLAKNGKISSMHFLGEAYFSGKYGLEKNTNLAIEYLKKAVQFSSIKSIMLLANIYWQDKDNLKNRKEAIELFDLAAQLGETKARDFLIKVCMENKDGLNEVERGLSWIKQSAEEGHLESILLLSRIYFCGQYNQEKNMDLYMKYIEKAANSGFMKPAYTVGNIYLNGLHGQKKSYEKGIIFHKKAASLGMTESMFLLGQAYLKGNYGLKIDLNQAIPYLYNAHTGGHKDAEKVILKIKNNSSINEPCKNIIASLKKNLQQIKNSDNKTKLQSEQIKKENKSIKKDNCIMSKNQFDLINEFKKEEIQKKKESKNKRKKEKKQLKKEKKKNNKSLNDNKTKESKNNENENLLTENNTKTTENTKIETKDDIPEDTKDDIPEDKKDASLENNILKDETKKQYIETESQETQKDVSNSDKIENNYINSHIKIFKDKFSQNKLKFKEIVEKFIKNNKEKFIKNDKGEFITFDKKNGFKKNSKVLEEYTKLQKNIFVDFLKDFEQRNKLPNKEEVRQVMAFKLCGSWAQNSSIPSSDIEFVVFLKSMKKEYFQWLSKLTDEMKEIFLLDKESFCPAIFKSEDYATKTGCLFTTMTPELFLSLNKIFIEKDARYSIERGSTAKEFLSKLDQDVKKIFEPFVENPVNCGTYVSDPTGDKISNILKSIPLDNSCLYGNQSLVHNFINNREKITNNIFNDCNKCLKSNHKYLQNLYPNFEAHFWDTITFQNFKFFSKVENKNFEESTKLLKDYFYRVVQLADLNKNYILKSQNVKNKNEKKTNLGSSFYNLTNYAYFLRIFESLHGFEETAKVAKVTFSKKIEGNRSDVIKLLTTNNFKNTQI